jgi:hypothetical protein
MMEPRPPRPASMSNGRTSVFQPCLPTSADSMPGRSSHLDLYLPFRNSSLQNRRRIRLPKPTHPALLLVLPDTNPLLPLHLYLHLPRPIHALHHPSRRNSLLHHAPRLSHTTPPSTVCSSQRSLSALRPAPRTANKDPPGP